MTLRDNTSHDSGELRLLQVTTLDIMLEWFLLPFGRWFRKRGWKVDALASGAASSDDCQAAFDRAFDCSWTRSPFSLRNYTTAPRIVRRVVAEGKYDIVHVHTPIAAFVTRWALRKMRRRGEVAVVYTAHGFHFHERGHPLKNVLFRSAEKLAGRWTDRLVVLTPADLDAAIEERLIDRDRLHLIPSIGIDSDRYDPAAVPDESVAALRAELGIPSDEAVLLAAARIAGGKHHDDMLRAAARTKQPVHLLFAGEGPLEQELEDLAGSLGIADRVHFLGHRADVPVLIKASAATLIASEREGLSVFALESMSMGVPVVGTDIRGVRELVGDDECGTLFPVGDVDAFVAAIDELLASPDVAATKGSRGRHLVRAYSVESVLAAYEELYLDVIRGRRLGEATP